METLSVIYWWRVGLGIIAGFICAAGLAFISSLLLGISFTLMFYIITYYILKMKFMAKVEKPSKIVTTGVGAYIMTWLVSWILFFTMVLWLQGKI